MTEINANTPMEKMTPGGDIYTAGNAREFKTGDWRSVKPVFLSESVNNVDYASLFVQMMQFQLIKKLYKEKISIMIIAKDVEYVLKHVHLVQLK